MERVMNVFDKLVIAALIILSSLGAIQLVEYIIWGAMPEKCSYCQPALDKIWRKDDR